MLYSSKYWETFTETCVYASCYTLDRFIIEGLDKMYIGWPLKNVEMFVLGDSGEVCSQDEIGEICIAGEGLAKGYVNNLELTKKNFICDQSIYPKRFYKTGDLGIVNKNGVFECLGRKDSQIKLHGFRIELLEIENIINNLRGIEENHIVLQHDGEESYIVSYFTTNENVNLEYLIQELAKVLPSYMIPSYFVKVDNFPVTINGKLDVSRLLDYRKYALRLEQKDSSAELSEEEQIVLDICKDILNCETINVHDNLAFYGLNSLMVFRIVLKIERMFGVDITINDILKVKNVAEIVLLIKRKDNRKKISTNHLRNRYKCTTFQNVIISLEKAANKKRDQQGKNHYPTYNMIYDITIGGKMDVIRLKQSIEKVCNNDIFKVNFKDDCTLFFNSKRDRNIVTIIDQPELSDVKDYIIDFDVEKQALIQFIIAHHCNTTKMIINVHHAIFDYLSVQNLIREILEVYSGQKGNFNNNKYFTYLEQRNKSMDEAITFWKKYYSGRNRCNQIPGDLRRRIKNTKDDLFDDYTVVKDNQWIQIFSNKIASRGVTLFEVLICAWAKLLNCYGGGDDIIIGTYMPGRIIKQHTFYDSFGCYLNAIGFRFLVKENESLLQVIDSFKKDYTLSEQYQYISYFDVVGYLDRDDLIKGELIGTMFNYVTFDEINYGGIDIKIREIGLEPETHPLSIKIFDYDNEVIIKLKYNSNIYSKMLVHEIMDKYIEIVDDILQ